MMDVSIHLQHGNRETNAQNIEGRAEHHEWSSSTVDAKDEELHLLQKQICTRAQSQYEANFGPMARRIVHTKAENRVATASSLGDKSAGFPKLQHQEILDGKILGKGGYGTVYEVRGFQLLDRRASLNTTAKRQTSLRMILKDSLRKHGSTVSTPSVLSNTLCASSSLRRLSRERADDDEELKNGEKESRKFIADHCFRNGGDARYAVKRLSKNTVTNKETLFQGVYDMAVEIHVLSNLTEHPNIVKMRAVSGGNRFDSNVFIVMDRLYDTLQKRLVTWRKRYQKSMGITGRLFKDRGGTKKAKLYEQCLVAAYDLSSALAHVHKYGIIHRDLKPENVGFDIRDDIKIFDFGLARVIPSSGMDKQGAFRFTAMCGTLRYMAPEVGLAQLYNASCDVFSFTILFWEIMALKRPYGTNISVLRLQEEVWGDGVRPPVDHLWSSAIKILLRRGWSSNPDERPKMTHVEAILRKECIQCKDGDEIGLQHNQRRSTHVFHRPPLHRSARAIPARTYIATLNESKKSV